METKEKKMLKSMEEVHAAIRTMSQDELDQLTRGVGMLYENGEITMDQAVEALGLIVAHTFERTMKAA